MTRPKSSTFTKLESLPRRPRITLDGFRSDLDAKSHEQWEQNVDEPDGVPPFRVFSLGYREKMHVGPGQEIERDHPDRFQYDAIWQDYKARREEIKAKFFLPGRRPGDWRPNNL